MKPKETEVKKTLIISFVLSLALTSSWAYATGIGGDIGFGYYWAAGGGTSGLALSGYADISLNKGFSLVPTIGLWTSNEYDVSITDIIPSVALKYTAPSKNISPFLGFEPQLHVFSSSGESRSYFGFNGFGGVDIPVSLTKSFLLQVSYGLIFGEGSTVNVFTAKIGMFAKI
jgi:hypothetical protein